MNLCETRTIALHALHTEKKCHKAWHDHVLKQKDLHKGDLALMYQSKVTKGKLKFSGLGPYQVMKIFENGAVQLATLEGDLLPTLVNGSRLRRYYHSPPTI